MAKIITKAALIIGSNYKLHLLDKQGTDIAISQTADTITSTVVDFTASSETAGIVKRAVRVGDRIKLSNTANAANEGAEAIVDSVAANSLGVTWITGGVVDEVAGADINIVAFIKEFEFLEAGGLSFVDGVDGITWASKVVDDWDVTDLDIYPRMFTSIEPRAKSSAALNGWRPLNLDTVNSIRGSALEIRPDANTAATQIYPLLRTSGLLHEATDQMTYWSENDAELGAPNNFVMTGYADQLVKVYDRDIDNNVISGATQANPVVIDLETGHGLVAGDKIEINDVVGMVELNGNTYEVANEGVNSVELLGVDGLAYTPYVSGGDFAIDNRGTWNYRCLVHGKTHLQDTIDAQYAEIYPVANNNGLDPKLSDGAGTPLVLDATILAGGIYANILLNEDVDSQYDGDVDSILYSFLGYVDADSEDNQTVHTKTHYLLRQTVNINNDGTGRVIRGDKAPAITVFLGEQMSVIHYYLLNYNEAERNLLRVVDDGDVERAWPTIRAITVTAAELAQGGTFSLIHKDTYGASLPTYLQNDIAVDQKDITIAASVVIVVAYSTYNVGGHTPDTPIALVLTWNRAGFIEPDFDDTIVLSNSDIIAPINPTADPSYSAA